MPRTATKVPYSLRLDPLAHTLLKAEAERRKTSMADLIKAAIGRYVSEIQASPPPES